MKTLLIPTVAIFLLWSCNPDNHSNTIDIQAIKACSEQGITSFSMDSLTIPEAFLDNAMVENTIGKIQVNEKADWFLKVNEWERLNCYQWEENEEHFLFTLLQQDEVCCLSMYLCLADKVGHVLAIQHLGLVGGDADWFEIDSGEKTGFGSFRLHYNSYTDQGEFDNGVHVGYSREHEYTELFLELKGNQFVVDTLNYNKSDSTISALLISEPENSEADTMSVMVVPSANDYEYAMSNFELDPLLETALSASKRMKIIPFPLKTMMGVAYDGVFDAKYCPSIIEKVAVDYLVLSRFDKEYHELNRTTMSWGYEVRIVNTHTLEQVNSIEAHNLEQYAEIEQHIKANIGSLVADMEELE